MTRSLIFFIQLMPIITTILLIMQQTHLLMSLLALESIMLALVLFITTTMALSGMSLNVMSITLLTFGACEASLGLGLMVMMSRSYGSDLINTLSMNKC